jgi:UDPglucose 6-dehydrogenase
VVWPQLRKQTQHKIAIFGLGYVGLVTAVCFAKKGYSVLGIDVDTQKLRQIRTLDTPFYEPRLVSYLREAVSKGSLQVTNEPAKSARSNLIFIAVGTPSKPDGSTDLAYVSNAVSMIGQTLRYVRPKNKPLVVIRSTVPPGTARNLVRLILEKESKETVGKDIGLCSNPEFLQEGRAIHDAEHPDRIIIGSDDDTSIRKLEAFYREFHGGKLPPIIRTTYENAELIKYANNAFLATKVSFINCIASIAEKVPHADINIVAKAIGLDKRISPYFLSAGLGWGGSCFPKDLKALIFLGRNLGCEPELIEAAVLRNERQRKKAVQFARRALGDLSGKKIALLGLAFKPNTDDIREAVSISLVRDLLAEGAEVVVYDPAAMKKARAVLRDTVTYARDAMGCIDQADCCIVVTEWREFERIRPEVFLERMKRPVVIDCRRIFDPSEFSQTPIKFLAIGLGTVR